MAAANPARTRGDAVTSDAMPHSRGGIGVSPHHNLIGPFVCPFQAFQASQDVFITVVVGVLGVKRPATMRRYGLSWVAFSGNRSFPFCKN